MTACVVGVDPVRVSEGPVGRVWVSADGERFLLDCWEISLALANSGTRLRWEMPAGEVAGLVVDGVRAVGGPEKLAAMREADRAHTLCAMADQVGAARRPRASAERYHRVRGAWWPAGEFQEFQSGKAMWLAWELCRAACGERVGVSSTFRFRVTTPPPPETASPAGVAWLTPAEVGWRGFLLAWRRVMPRRPVTARELCQSAATDPYGWGGTFPTTSLGEVPSAKSLGRILAARTGHVVGDLVVRSVIDAHTKIRVYWVELPDHPPLINRLAGADSSGRGEQR